MEEYIGLEIEEFGIFLRYPEWWNHRIEGAHTYHFWDDYVGSFRLTPQRVKAKELATLVEEQGKQHAGSKMRKIGSRQFLCFETLQTNAEGASIRSHHYVGGQDGVLISGTFAYKAALLEDEFAADGVAAALEEVEILLEGLNFGEED